MAAGDEYFEDLLKIIMHYSGERNTAENVMYASCLGAHGATLDDLDSLAEAIGTSWSDEVMPLVSSSITFTTCYVADWTDADGLTGAYDVGTVGGLTGDQLPDQVATLVNLDSLLRYRGGRGRIYIPQPDVTKVETGTTWTSAFVTAMTDAIVAYLASVAEREIGDDLLTPVLYHRAGNKDVAQGYEDIVGAAASITPGTQRRRVRRVGHKA